MSRTEAIRKLTAGAKRVAEQRKSKDSALADALRDLATAVELLLDHQAEADAYVDEIACHAALSIPPLPTREAFAGTPEDGS